MIYTLKNEQITVQINTTGAELTSVVSDSGYEYIWQGAHWPKHSPVLFPICGSLLDGKYILKGREYPLGKHGFTREAEFDVVESSETSLTLKFESDEKTLSVYPFEFALYATFSIEENRLSAIFTVENVGKQIMPYMFGWHPAFTLGGSREIGSFYVAFDGKRSLTRHSLQHGAFVNPFYSSYPLKAGKYYLNEEEIYSSDTMIFKDVPTSVRLAGGYQKHTVTLSYSDNLPYLCIWKFPSADARFICLEPWSDIPSDGETPENFLSRAMSRLSPLEKADYEYNVAFE